MQIALCRGPSPHSPSRCYRSDRTRRREWPCPNPCPGNHAPASLPVAPAAAILARAFLKSPTNSFFLVFTDITGLATTIKALGKRVDVFKLRIAVGVLPALQRLGIRLKAIVELVQQVGDFTISNDVALSLKLLCQTPCAFTGPTQQRLRVSPARRLHQASSACTMSGA